MKIRPRFIAVAFAVLLVMALILWSVWQNKGIQSEDGRAASAIDQAGSRLSPELIEVLSKAGSSELIKVWVELDKDEYANKTGKRMFFLIRQYKASGMEKIQREAFDELIPEEIIAVICKYSTGVEPPVELAERHHYLVWYTSELTPSMIKSISNFPGVQRITLYKEASVSYVDPIIASYIAKVAEEYPTYRIKLLTGLAQQFSTETGAPYYSYKSIEQTLQKYSGEIIYNGLTSVHTVAPANLQLVAELSALDEVESIYLNWVHTID